MHSARRKPATLIGLKPKSLPVSRSTAPTRQEFALRFASMVASRDGALESQQVLPGPCLLIGQGHQGSPKEQASAFDNAHNRKRSNVLPPIRSAGLS